jgi:hypothetical protein
MVTPKEFLNGNFVDLAAAPSGEGEALGANGVYALDASGLLLLMMPKNIMTLGKSLDGVVNLQVGTDLSCQACNEHGHASQHIISTACSAQLARPQM